jgi:hypothetical protein
VGKEQTCKVHSHCGDEGLYWRCFTILCSMPSVCCLCEIWYMILHIRPITRKSAVPHHAAVLAACTCNVEYLSMPCAMVGWDISETWRGGFAIKRAPESIRFQPTAPMTSLRLVD